MDLESGFEEENLGHQATRQLDDQQLPAHQPLCHDRRVVDSENGTMDTDGGSHNHGLTIG